MGKSEWSYDEMGLGCGAWAALAGYCLLSAAC